MLNSLVTFLKHIDKCGTSSEMMLCAYNLLVLCGFVQPAGFQT